jgi:hypothetical protein
LNEPVKSEPNYTDDIFAFEDNFSSNFEKIKTRPRYSPLKLSKDSSKEGSDFVSLSKASTGNEI